MLIRGEIGIILTFYLNWILNLKFFLKGIGKSLFLRKLLFSMKNKIDSMSNFKYSEKPSIIISSLNPLTK